MRYKLTTTDTSVYTGEQTLDLTASSLRDLAEEVESWAGAEGRATVAYEIDAEEEGDWDGDEPRYSSGWDNRSSDTPREATVEDVIAYVANLLDLPTKRITITEIPSFGAFVIDDYLSKEVAEETSGTKRAAIQAAADQIEAAYPDPDDADARANALNAATQIILGDETIEQIGGAYLAARRRMEEAREALTGAIIASAPYLSEYDLERATGISRPTVRKILGK